MTATDAIRTSRQPPLRWFALIVVAVAAWCISSADASAAKPRVTVFGDSVQASFGFSPQAIRRLSPGLQVRLEARVCRKLSSPGCLGGTPASVLAVASSLGPSLGDVVVVHTGYNDFASRYDVAGVLHTFRRAGVRAVVWVTLREAHGHYANTNALIRAASRRVAQRRDLPIVRVADWNAYSVGRPWFTSDGVHLNSAGALGLATLLRESVLSALADVGTSVDGRPVTVRAQVVPLPRRASRIAGEGGIVWAAGPGRMDGVNERTGRRVPPSAPLAAGEDLASDGRRPWIRSPAEGAITRPKIAEPGVRGPRLDGVGAQPLLARTDTSLWAVAPCTPDGHACLTSQSLLAVEDGGERRAVALTSGVVKSAAADPDALWLLVSDGDGAAARLERRDPATGEPVRVTALPRQAASGVVVAGQRRAWVLTANGQLLRVGLGGRARRVAGRLRAVASVDGQLWAIRADRRTVLNLDPQTGQARRRATAGHALSSQMTFTRSHLWILTASGRNLVRLPRA